jgi:rhodanese-related sulfurtransferase
MAASVILDFMVRTVTPAQLVELASTQAVDLIDVRDVPEWDSAHIDGARLVPLDRFRTDPDAALVRNTPTVFICAKGVRSMQAAKLAERFGYEQIYHLAGGMKEWSRSGLSLVAESRAAA